MPDPNALADRLAAAAADLAGLESPIADAGPWPLAERFDHSDESAWGPPEILAHVDEMLPYWLGELERVLAAPPGSVAPFGRTATDDVRLALIERDRTVPQGELFDRASSSAARVGRRIRRLTPDELARSGRHPVRGEMPVADLLERFLIGHLEEHVRQLREALPASGRPPAA